MQNCDYFSWLRALKVLITAHSPVNKDPAGGVGKKCLRAHLRVHRLREYIAKGQPENIGAQVVDVRHAAKIVGELPLGVQSYLGSPLIYGTRIRLSTLV